MWLKAPVVVLAATFAALAASSCGSSNSTSTSTSRSTSSAARGPGNGALAVTPTTGNRDTSFTFTFTAPQTVGRHGTTQTAYTLAVVHPFQSGCLADRTVSVGNAVAGSQVSVTLDPGKLGGVWCQGSYSARVTEIQMPYCSPGTMCPQFVRLVATVGRTSFSVSG